MNVSIIPTDVPMTVQRGQCRDCLTRGLYRLLMTVGKERTWILAEQIPEGYRVHDCKPDLKQAA